MLFLRKRIANRMFSLLQQHALKLLKIMGQILFIGLAFISFSQSAALTSSQLTTSSAPTLPFQSVVYLNPVLLNGDKAHQNYHQTLATYTKGLALSDVKFKNLKMNWSTFLAPVTIYYVKLDNDSGFYFNQFNDTVALLKLNCRANCIFYGNIFTHKLSVNKSMFNQYLSFKHSLFKEDVFFEQSYFNQDADFSRMTVNKDISFNDSFFDKSLSLAHSVFKGHVSFNDTHLPHYLDLSYVQLTHKLDLSQMNLGILNYVIDINLVGADLNQIMLDYTHFKLVFPDTASINEIQHTYLTLLKQFKEANQQASYKRLFAEYEEYMNLYHKEYVQNVISKYWWCYGTHPEWIFFWMLMLLLFFTCINTCFYDTLTKRYCNIPFLVDKQSHFVVRRYAMIRLIYYFPRALIFTLMMFVGAQFRLGIGTDAFKSTNLAINLYFITIIFSGVLCLFFLFKYILAQLG